MTLLHDRSLARRHYQAENAILSAPIPTALVLAAVAEERARQEQLHDDGKLDGVRCSERGVSNSAKLPVLVEEVGEVAKQINEGSLTTKDRAHLRKELIQAAAVCVAWAESLTEKEGA